MSNSVKLSPEEQYKTRLRRARLIFWSTLLCVFVCAVTSILLRTSFLNRTICAIFVLFSCCTFIRWNWKDLKYIKGNKEQVLLEIRQTEQTRVLEGSAELKQLQSKLYTLRTLERSAEELIEYCGGNKKRIIALEDITQELDEKIHATQGKIDSTRQVLLMDFSFPSTPAPEST